MPQYIYYLKPKIDYINFLKNKLKNYEFYCIKVKIGTQHSKEFFNLNNVVITSSFRHNFDQIKCYAIFMKNCGSFYKAKSFETDFELNIFIKCLKCGSVFDNEEKFNFHKNYCY